MGFKRSWVQIPPARLGKNDGAVALTARLVQRKACGVAGQASPAGKQALRLVLGVGGFFMRVPSPWWRESEQAYYIQLGKKQYRLGRTDKEAKAKLEELNALGLGAGRFAHHQITDDVPIPRRS